MLNKRYLIGKYDGYVPLYEKYNVLCCRYKSADEISDFKEAA
jgi:hypothetical protein